MSLKPACIVIVDKGTAAHREAVQAIVKVHANGWWHNFADVWIVGGHPSAYWRDLIKPTLALSPARVLVLDLPAEGSRGWASSGVPTVALDWLTKTYTNRATRATAKPFLTAPGKTAAPPRTITDDDIPF